MHHAAEMPVLIEYFIDLFSIKEKQNKKKKTQQKGFSWDHSDKHNHINWSKGI